MNSRKRYGVGLALFVLTLLALTIFLAPRQNNLGTGSTYSRNPSGYGAWYAYMGDRGTPVERWEKPTDVFLSTSESRKKDRPKTPITLLQIQTDFMPSPSPIVYDREWISQGNVLLQVGMRTRVTNAPFRSDIASPQGKVVIETRRRHSLSFPLTYQGLEEAKPKALLEDPYGAIAWEETIGRGRVIFVVTPHLAANAYQNELGNFEFLATLLENIGHPIYVDEYLHGYKDDDTITEETGGSLGAYLWETPLSILALQGVGVLMLLIWGLNRRLGPADKLRPPTQDSNRTYINALASILRKANCTDFAVETLQKAELLNVQRSLGFGDTPLETETLKAAWEAQTGRSPDDLHPLLSSSRPVRKSMTEVELQQWLEAIAQIRHHLPERGSPTLANVEAQPQSHPVLRS